MARVVLARPWEGRQPGDVVDVPGDVASRLVLASIGRVDRRAPAVMASGEVPLNVAAILATLTTATSLPGKVILDEADHKDLVRTRDQAVADLAQASADLATARAHAEDQRRDNDALSLSVAGLSSELEGLREELARSQERLTQADADLGACHDLIRAALAPATLDNLTVPQLHAAAAWLGVDPGSMNKDALVKVLAEAVASRFPAP